MRRGPCPAHGPHASRMGKTKRHASRGEAHRLDSKAGTWGAGPRETETRERQRGRACRRHIYF
eukprot:3088061-Prymnesium_polylepis.1